MISRSPRLKVLLSLQIAWALVVSVSWPIVIGREFDFAPRDPRSVNLNHCRVVIRFGELDRLIPYQAATEHAKSFRRADVGVLRGVGHVPAEEVPDQVAALIASVAGD